MLGTLQVTPTFRQMCRSLSLHFASAPECSPGACTHMTRKVAKAASLSCTPEDVAAIALHFYRLASQSLDASEYRNDAALSALQCLICQAEAQRGQFCQRMKLRGMSEASSASWSS